MQRIIWNGENGKVEATAIRYGFRSYAVDMRIAGMGSYCTAPTLKVAWNKALHNLVNIMNKGV